MDPKIWLEAQKHNPDTQQYLVNQVKGFQALKERQQKVLNEVRKEQGQVTNLMNITNVNRITTQNYQQQRTKELAQRNSQLMDQVFMLQSFLEAYANNHHSLEKDTMQEVQLMKTVQNTLDEKEVLDSTIDSIREQIYEKRKEEAGEERVSEEQSLSSQNQMIDSLFEMKKGISLLQSFLQSTNYQMHELLNLQQKAP